MCEGGGRVSLLCTLDLRASRGQHLRLQIFGKPPQMPSALHLSEWSGSPVLQERAVNGACVSMGAGVYWNSLVPSPTPSFLLLAVRKSGEGLIYFLTRVT